MTYTHIAKKHKEITGQLVAMQRKIKNNPNDAYNTVYIKLCEAYKQRLQNIEASIPIYNTKSQCGNYCP